MRGWLPLAAVPVVCVSRLFQRIVFATSVVIFAALGLGYILGEFGWFGVRAGDGQSAAYNQMRVYAEVLRKIQNYYVTEPNIPEVTNGALHGLLDSLDPDSSYLSAAEYKIYKDRPSTDNAQVGVTVSKRFGYATIVNVLPGSPADQDHLRDGDVIDLIEGQSTHDLPLALVRFMLEGKPGTTVTITVVRPSSPTRTRSRSRAPCWPARAGRAALREREQSFTSSPACSPPRASTISPPHQGRRQRPQDSPRPPRHHRQRPQAGMRLANFFLKQGTLGSLGARSFPCRPSPPIPPMAHRRACGCPGEPRHLGRARLTAAAIEGAQARRYGRRRPSARARCKKPSTCPTAARSCSPSPSTRTPAARRSRTRPLRPPWSSPAPRTPESPCLLRTATNSSIRRFRY